MEEEDFSDIIVRLLLAEDAELSLRLAEQDEALRETKCEDPRVGKWVDEYELNYLFAALRLGDGDFATCFPEMQHVTRREREELTVTIKRHVNDCPHCSLKQGYDLEWAGRVKRVCQGQRQAVLGRKREESEDESVSKEGEHRGDTTLRTAQVII